MHPLHTFPPYFPNTLSNMIFPSTPRSTSCLFFPGIPTTILYLSFTFSMHATRSAPLTLIEFITLITCGEAYKLWSSSLCLPPLPPSQIQTFPSAYLVSNILNLYYSIQNNKQMVLMLPIVNKLQISSSSSNSSSSSSSSSGGGGGSSSSGGGSSSSNSSRSIILVLKDV